MMNDTRSTAKKAALGGILGALTIICLFFAVTLPTSRLSLYALASFFISVVIIETGIVSGWIFYGATGLLALLLLPDKTGVVPYVIFFGLYGIIKYYIEKLGKLVPEIILKLVFFNACFFAAVYLIKSFFMMEIKVQLPWWALILIFEVIFLVYDYVYSLFIDYFRKKIRPKLGL
jgi:hypothetical protein